MIVKVERIRRGRRLPEVDYVEARSPRRAQVDRQEFDGGRGVRRVPPAEPSQSRLRLPWRINKSSA